MQISELLLKKDFTVFLHGKKSFK